MYTGLQFLKPGQGPEKHWSKVISKKIMGIGPKTFKLLISHFNTLENLLNANHDELRKVSTIGPIRSKQIYSGLQKLKEEVKNFH